MGFLYVHVPGVRRHESTALAPHWNCVPDRTAIASNKQTTSALGIVAEYVPSKDKSRVRFPEGAIFFIFVIVAAFVSCPLVCHACFPLCLATSVALGAGVAFVPFFFWPQLLCVENFHLAGKAA